MEVAPPNKLLTLITLISLLYGFMGFGAKKQSGQTSEWILVTPLTAITKRAPVVLINTGLPGLHQKSTQTNTQTQLADPVASQYERPHWSTAQPIRARPLWPGGR